MFLWLLTHYICTAAGPFDEVDDNNSWRRMYGGGHIFTNEAIVRGKRPDEMQQEYQTKFWRKYDAHKVQVGRGDVREHRQVVKESALLQTAPSGNLARSILFRRAPYLHSTQSPTSYSAPGRLRYRRRVRSRRRLPPRRPHRADTHWPIHHPPSR